MIARAAMMPSSLQECGGDQHAVDEVVHGIAHDDQQPAAALFVLVPVVHLAVLGMAVAPEQELLQHEEGEDAGEDRDRSLARRAFFERVRDHLEERGAEQRTDRVRHQHRYPARPHEKRERGERGRQRAAGEARHEDPAQGHIGMKRQG
jgi:hypothetical protein